MQWTRSTHVFLSLVMIYGSAFVATSETILTSVELQHTGIGYELIQERLDFLQYRFVEMFVHVKELGETILINQRTIEENQLRTNQLVQGNHKKIIDRLDTLEKRFDDLDIGVAANVSLMAGYAKQILDLQTVCANHDYILKELNQLKPNFTLSSGANRIPPIYELNLTDLSSTSRISSCNKSNEKLSGIYEMVLPDSRDPITVYCEMQAFGGGWLVFQQRVNGSVNFYRNWTEYRNGFGVIGGEFWMGLSALHRITTQGSYELMVEFRDFSDQEKYARYSEFRIGSEEEKFELKKLGVHSGTADDALSYHLGMKFSTFDSDNDRDSTNCAQTYSGAWWYNACYGSSLNGRHENSGTSAICWGNDCKLRSKYTRMMIRAK